MRVGNGRWLAFDATGEEDATGKENATGKEGATGKEDATGKENATGKEPDAPFLPALVSEFMISGKVILTSFLS
jgi:hypothetical protein